MKQEYLNMISFFVELNVPFRCVPKESKLFLMTNYGEQMLVFKEDGLVLYYLWNKPTPFKYEEKDQYRMLLKNLAFIS